MGGASSHPAPVAKAENVEDEEGGFHMIEVHTPSVGLGAFTVLTCVIAALVVFLLYRRYCKDGGRIQANSQIPVNPNSTYAFPPVPPAAAYPHLLSAPFAEPGYPAFSRPFYPAFHMSNLTPAASSTAQTRAVSHIPHIEILDESPRPARHPAPRAATSSSSARPATAAVPSTSTSLACDV